MRSLIRSREALIKNLHRSNMQVIHFLHARGRSYNAGGYWTQKFMIWINKVELDQPNDAHVLRGNLTDITDIQSRIQEVEQQIRTASESFRFQEPIRILQSFRGIGLITAMQLVCEIGDFRRFEKPTALMAYLGLVPSQRSLGNTIRSDSITKTGNIHARKALIVQPGNTYTIPGSVHPFVNGTAVPEPWRLANGHKNVYTNDTKY